MHRAPSHRLALVALIGIGAALSACRSDDDDRQSMPGDTAGTDIVGTAGDGAAGVDSTGNVTAEDVGSGAGNGTLSGDGNGDGVDAGDGGAIGTHTGDVARFGLVRLRTPDELDGDDGDAFASFVRFQTAQPAERLRARFGPIVDTCRVETDADASDDNQLFANAVGRPFEFIDAGDNIVFTSDSVGTWLVLDRVTRTDFVGYELQARPISIPLPTDMTLAVMGADFPGFVSVELGNAEPLVVIAPADEGGAAPSTTFQWQSDPDSKARIEIELDFPDAADNGDDIEVTCSVADDGEFALQQVVLDQLPANVTGELGIERVAVTIREQGDVMLVVKNTASGGL